MSSTTHPAAYLRRSYVDPDSPGDISLEAQRTTVRGLAAKDGHNGNLVEYSDWGISADIAKAGKRTAYARLLADMEAGALSAVYAFDVDRLYRDPRDLIRLQDAAQRYAVRIVTTAGALAIGDGDDPAAEGFAFMGAVFGRMELQKAKKRARAARAARLARGDVFGHPSLGFRHERDATGRIVQVADPGANLAPIRQALVDAGTVLGATKLLNARRIPTVRGGGRWSLSMVQRTVARHWPELLPARGASGKRIRATSTLSQLVRCHCGNVMTPNNVKRQLYCSRAVTIGREAHGRYNVTQASIIAWCQGEAARLQVPHDRLELAADAEARRTAVEAQRERLGWAVTDGLLSREAAKAKATALDAELAGLEQRDELVEIPTIDWSWAPAEINAVLRALWHHVQLGPDMAPVSAEWKVPEWRSSP
jgi:DNA invertase Pin-like site-specific DNA recombinase